MSRLTDDPNDPELTRGVDAEPVAQAPAYLVPSEAERAKGFVRPLRSSYRHVGPEGTGGGCDSITTMSIAIAETYARQPSFYGATYCIGCCRHIAVDEFVWTGTAERVGS